MRDLPHTTPDTWLDAIAYWLSDHPWVPACVLFLAAIAGVGYLDTPATVMLP
jgi:hypothetical protein